MKNLLVTICGRAGSQGLASKNLKHFCGQPIVYYSLAAADLFRQAHPQLRCDICLNTDSEELWETVRARYPEVVFLPREEALCGADVAKEEVYRDCLLRMEEKNGLVYDALIDLDITSPLRQDFDLEQAFQLFLQDENADVVLSAAPARRNPYYNMGRLGENGYAVRVIENRNTARQQAPLCYDFNASLYIFRRTFLAEGMDFDLWDGNMKAYLMYDTGILDIDCEEDYQLLQVLGGYLFQNKPGFAAVQNAIRGKNA